MAKLRKLPAGVATRLAALALAVALIAQFHGRSRSEAPAAARFDYYVLSLSWAPGFCSQPGEASRNPKECGRGVGFIVHGFWPKAAAGRSPESCGKAGRVPKAVVNYALRDMVTAGFIQYEWATHGTCTGLTPFDYFSSMVQARASVQIPVKITSIEGQIRESPAQIEAQFAEANPSFPRAAFRTSCPMGVFEEERVCFDKSLKPQACTANVGECGVPAVIVSPPL